MTTEEILTGYYRAVAEAHNDVDAKQLQWIFQQAAIRLDWEVPELNEQQVRPGPVRQSFILNYGNGGTAANLSNSTNGSLNDELL
jgi:hypothetical protein